MWEVPSSSAERFRYCCAQSLWGITHSMRLTLLRKLFSCVELDLLSGKTSGGSVMLTQESGELLVGMTKLQRSIPAEERCTSLYLLGVVSNTLRHKSSYLFKPLANSQWA